MIDFCIYFQPMRDCQGVWHMIENVTNRNDQYYLRINIRIISNKADIKKTKVTAA